MAKYMLLIAVACGALSAYGAYAAARTVPQKTGTLRIGKTAFSVVIADTALARVRGLSGKRALPARDGMLFVFPKPDMYPFWMQGMQFPLDLIWIEGGTVADITYNARPMSETGYKLYTPRAPISRVLEITAGSARRYGIKIGDTVSLH